VNFPYPCRRTRVKICGFTRPEDAQRAVRLGADAIGLVFYPQSPRFVEVDQASTIVSRLPPFVTVVGLLVDADASWVRQILARVRIDLLQFHGDEDPTYCSLFGRPYIKAIRMRPGVDLAAMIERYPEASGFLLDAWHSDAPGGTGRRFDWNLIPKSNRDSMILAGGLTVENIREALQLLRPYALDVSSGVEREKGIKDAAKMAAFLQEVQAFDYRESVDRTL
jgi:phosphoribosylanthranilate isomerase